MFVVISFLGQDVERGGWFMRQRETSTGKCPKKFGHYLPFLGALEKLGSILVGLEDAQLQGEGNCLQCIAPSFARSKAIRCGDAARSSGGAKNS